MTATINNGTVTITNPAGGKGSISINEQVTFGTVVAGGCGGTVWHGRYAMRISVSSWATDEHDVDVSLAALARIARDCKDQSASEGNAKR